MHQPRQLQWWQKMQQKEATLSGKPFSGQITEWDAEVSSVTTLLLVVLIDGNLLMVFTLGVN